MQLLPVFLYLPKRGDLLNFHWVTGKPFFLVHYFVCEKLGSMDRWGKQFFWNDLNIYLDLIIFLPSISISSILQLVLGTSSQVLSSTPSNLPILNKFSLLDKTFSSSHKSSSSVRLNLSLPRYIVVLFNFILFCSFYD